MRFLSALLHHLTLSVRISASFQLGQYKIDAIIAACMIGSKTSIRHCNTRKSQKGVTRFFACCPGRQRDLDCRIGAREARVQFFFYGIVLCV